MDYNNYLKNSKFFEFSENEYINRAKNLQENSSFRSMVSNLLQEEFDKNNSFDSQEEILAEESLYKGGFFSNADKQLMNKFHKSEWSEKLKICDDFDDERLFYFGMRLLYEEQPSILPKEIFNNIHSSIANQVLSMNNEKWYTIPKAYKDSDDLKVKYDNENSERKIITHAIKEKFPNLDAVIGGQISIDIYPKGKDKSQILKHVMADYSTPYDSQVEFIFIGDTERDYILSKKFNSPFYLIKSIHTNEEYFEKLNIYPLRNIDDFKNQFEKIT